MEDLPNDADEVQVLFCGCRQAHPVLQDGLFVNNEQYYGQSPFHGLKVQNITAWGEAPSEAPGIQM